MWCIVLSFVGLGLCFTVLDHGVKLGDFEKKDVTAEDIIEMVRTGEVKGEICND